MFTKAFWIAACERALKSAGQFGVFALGTTAFTEVGDVVNTAEAVVMSMLFGVILSLLTSMASAGIGNEGPSLANESVLSEWE